MWGDSRPANRAGPFRVRQTLVGTDLPVHSARTQEK
ncbi:RBM6 isoform 7 [Pan troglodytes]|uniref:RBM6 isoform 7 n=1 Tax=Pan troglodytes TaxID=9598 RepID=A0A2J8P938_PANTR|nr:RBM6 isoform 7 [Pan troglodytes]